MKKTSQKEIALIILALAVVLGIWLGMQDKSLAWYWAFGIGFGTVLQRSRVCFVSASSDPFLTGSTDLIRAILIGILVSSLGVTAIKYLSNGTLDLLGVSAVSLPLVLGAFIFGVGMILAGACSSGSFIRMAEGYPIHLITLLCIIIGYSFANSHYQTMWAPFITDAPVVFFPEALGGWIPGVFASTAIILALYFIAYKYGQRVSPSDNSAYLKGAVLLGIMSAIHIIVLESGWSVTGAFFWMGDIGSALFTDASGVPDMLRDMPVIAVGTNLRNLGLFTGALISVLFSTGFHIKKIRSGKQICKTVIGGLLMGYGACIAGGCNISAFFVAASSLSLSAWVFMVFLLAGAFAGIKLLYKFI